MSITQAQEPSSATPSQSTMATPPTLLAAHEGQSGPFVDWLIKLGLEEFLKRYPLQTLVEWGWVVPQYRIPFPRRFFECWENYPSCGWNVPDDLDSYAILWDSYWFLDTDDDPLWFLDPLFHPDNLAGKLLRQHAHTRQPLPDPVTTARGISVKPYADYFFPWQGYALVDLVRFSDSFPPIHHTPALTDAIESMVNISKWVSQEDTGWPKSILVAPKRWGGLATPMTWLAIFKTFRNVLVQKYRDDDDLLQKQYHKGADALAAHLGITAESLASAIKNHLLVLAAEWMRANKPITRSSHWTLNAWPYLQADIQLAMAWLYHLTGNTLEHYVKEWSLPYMGNWKWAKLDDALPYAFMAHKKTFNFVAPYYLKSFVETGSTLRNLEATVLDNPVSNLCRKNYTFAGFLAAFHELHEHLNYKTGDTRSLDFRELRPLDHFALLAIHAEGCLRRELDSLGLLDSIKSDKQVLPVYVEALAQARNIPERIIGCYNANRGLASLKKDRIDPIGRIQSVSSSLPAAELQVVQAFLSCQLARNYFAHHDFLDHELLRSEKAAFMLKGILLTVLILLSTE